MGCSSSKQLGETDLESSVSPARVSGRNYASPAHTVQELREYSDRNNIDDVFADRKSWENGRKSSELRFHVTAPLAIAVTGQRPERPLANTPKYRSIGRASEN